MLGLFYSVHEAIETLGVRGSQYFFSDTAAASAVTVSLFYLYYKITIITICYIMIMIMVVIIIPIIMTTINIDISIIKLIHFLRISLSCCILFLRKIKFLCNISNFIFLYTLFENFYIAGMCFYFSSFFYCFNDFVF